MAAELSFITIFQRWGKTLTLFLRQNIEKSGAEWNSFKPPTTPAPGKKLKKGETVHPRMWKTGKTKDNAFKYRAEDTKLTLYVDKVYEGIIEGNNKDGPFSRINQVSLFPTDASVGQFETLKVVQDMRKDITDETRNYFQTVLNTDIARIIRI